MRIFDDPGCRSLLLRVFPSNPSAGANFSVAVPADRRWKLEAFWMRLTCSATVASRIPDLGIWDTSSGKFYFRALFANQAASSDIRYSFGANLTPQALVGNYLVTQLPDIWIPPGSTIGTNIGALQAGDQIQELALLGEYQLI